METKREEYLKVVLSSKVVKMYLDLYARALAHQFFLEVDDVRQDLLVHLVKTAHRYNPAKGAVSTYAKVCLSTAKNHIGVKYTRRGRWGVEAVPYTESKARDEQWDRNIDLWDRLERVPRQEGRYAALLATGFSKKEARAAVGLSVRHGMRADRNLAEALAS